MIHFDPFGWLERFFSAKTLHLLIRLFVGAMLVVFHIHRILSFHRFWFKPLWGVETLIFAVFLLIYIIRKDPVDRSRGTREILIPLLGGVLPFGLLLSPVHPWVLRSETHLYAVFIWMTGATCLTLWGLWTLKRSFSVTVEVRELVTGGPYRFVRHPIYLGEILTASAVAVLRLSWINLFLTALFIMIQLYRSRMEEEKLLRFFPDYKHFAASSFWFWRPPS
jgi:protein-S-isoprenylcysteine O-methyltransferase Ste14